MKSRLQGFVAGLFFLTVLAFAGSSNFDRLVLGESNYGSDPASTSQADISLENDEAISNQTDDMVTFTGVGGSDNTDLRIDLDGTHPVIDSPTDTAIEFLDAVTLPSGSISSSEIEDGTIAAADEAFAGRGQIVICGDATTVNDNTVYYGPIVTVNASDTGGMDCDVTAAGNATEATADAPAFTAKAFHVRGMVCRTADTNATVSYTLRTAGGATVPSVTCSVSDNELDCVADVQTTTAIASAATVAVAVASTADMGAAAFVCTIDIAY